MGGCFINDKVSMITLKVGAKNVTINTPKSFSGKFYETSRIAV